MTSDTQTSPLTEFPLVVSTQSQKPIARLLLRNDLGQVVQQWLVKQNKCTLGSAVGCSLRCTQPGIAPYHALLVVGARQTFVRALAPKLTRAGLQTNEILLTDDSSSFEIAGHHFELTRGANPSKQQNQEPESNGRLKFTLARPFELNSRTNPPEVKTEAKPDADAASAKWVAKLVQSAVEPLECQLHNVLAPIAELQAEARRQRRLRKKRLAAKRQRAEQAEELGFAEPGPPAQQPVTSDIVNSEIQSQLESIVARQSAAMDTLAERISDVGNQLAIIESISAQDREPAADESDVNEQVATQNVAIEQLQSGIVAVSTALQNLQERQQLANEENSQWKSDVQVQLGAISESLREADRRAERLEGSPVILEALERLQSSQTKSQQEIDAWKDEINLQMKAIQASLEVSHSEDTTNDKDAHLAQQLSDLQVRQEQSLHEATEFKAEMLTQLAELQVILQETRYEQQPLAAEQHVAESEEFAASDDAAEQEVIVEQEVACEQEVVVEQEIVVEQDADAEYSEVAETEITTEQEANAKHEIAAELEADAETGIPEGNEGSWDQANLTDHAPATDQDLLDAGPHTVAEPAELENVTELDTTSEDVNFAEQAAIASHEDIAERESISEPDHAVELDLDAPHELAAVDVSADSIVLDEVITQADIIGNVAGESCESTEVAAESRDVTEQNQVPEDWSDFGAESELGAESESTAENESTSEEIVDDQTLAADDANTNIESSTVVDAFEDPLLSNDQAIVTENQGWPTLDVQDADIDEAVSDVYAELTTADIDPDALGESLDWQSESAFSPASPSDDVPAQGTTEHQASAAEQRLSSDEDGNSVEADALVPLQDLADEPIATEFVFDGLEPVADSDVDSDFTAADDPILEAPILEDPAEPRLDDHRECDEAEADSRPAAGALLDEFGLPFPSEPVADIVYGDLESSEDSANVDGNLPSWWTEADEANRVKGLDEHELHETAPQLNQPHEDTEAEATDADTSIAEDTSSSPGRESEEFFGLTSNVDAPETDAEQPLPEPVNFFKQHFDEPVADDAGIEPEFFGLADSQSMEGQDLQLEASLEKRNEDPNIFTELDLELISESPSSDDEIVDGPSAVSPDAASPVAESPAAGSIASDGLNVDSEEDDDSVEDYMRKLLARMRGVSEEQIELPTAKQETPPKNANPSRTSTAVQPVAEANETEKPTTGPATVGETNEQTAAFDPERYVPRALAPEANQNLAAMRELANSSARTAISTSHRQRHVTSVLLKLSISGIGFFVAVVLLAINGLTVNIGLIATFASIVVAVIWGYDGLSSLRPLLQSELILNPNSGKSENEDADEK